MNASVEEIARVCHEVNRAYCAAIGDLSQKPWGDCEQWQRESAVSGVKGLLDNPDMTPEKGHLFWMEHKRAAGWKLGPVKDPELREHPCMVPYAELPLEQRVKDYLFAAVVKSMVGRT